MNLFDAKELIKYKIENIPRKFYSLEKLFLDDKKLFSELSGLKFDSPIKEIIFNIENNRFGPGICQVCGGNTKEVWRKFCSVSCGNSADSSRTKNSEEKKVLNGTSLSNPIIREKYKDTMISRYGSEFPSRLDFVKDKKRETCLKNYGVEYPSQSIRVMDRIVDTKVQRFGEDYAKEFRKKSIKTHRNTVIRKTKENNKDWDIIFPIDWSGCHEEPFYATHKCGYLDEFWLWSGSKILKCSRCDRTSIPHKIVIDFLKNLGIDFIVNDRKIISPKELDIVVESHKIAIEVNGVYNHSEVSGCKGKLYHISKTESAARSGYQLIHISDMDILNRWESVSVMLMSKFGLLERVFARKTKVQKITKQLANNFLTKYHIQGPYDYGDVQYGLFILDELVSVMTFCETNSTDWELTRFCSNKSVIGGASKIISAFRKEYNGAIFSYSDLRWSNGNMYNKIGFCKLSKSEPSYWYFKLKNFNNMFHKNIFENYRTSDYKNTHLTELEIMVSKGYDRIWDCGTIEWKLL